MTGQDNPCSCLVQQRQHTSLASLFLYSFPSQGKASLTSGQRMAKHLLPEPGQQPGWEESRHCNPGRSAHPEHKIPLQVAPKAQLWLFVPSPHTSHFPPHSIISSKPGTEGPLSYLLPIAHLPPAAFLIKQATTPKPTFFPSFPPTFCLPHPLPHYPGSCFCLSWLFWAGGSLGKRIQFKCLLLRMCSSHFS